MKDQGTNEQVNIPVAAIYDLNPIQLAILTHVTLVAQGNDGICAESMQIMAKKLHIPTSQISSGLCNIVEKGWLIELPREGYDIARFAIAPARPEYEEEIIKIADARG